ncbi:hypothetical protein P3T36_001918 [Kitasatospora sp. MAP12-15]|uniref:hypothetical protein n=1 Tax=unclassified Kitasatospora TaxID=2633591 RepID=UPI0024733F47|nr:hypothetical protein [Kitasatospora sp. MAP12-44]MDH6111602.1 hypothetical protein [Kitasatospora sp. MAP12-44]
MDPISAAALAALAGGVGGEAGRQAWQGLTALVRRPFRRGSAGDLSADLSDISSGHEELAALEGAPADPTRAQALVTTLSVRAALDAEFRGLLADWWQQAQSIDTTGEFHNRITGGTQNGPVFQGRDFSNITFTVPPSSPTTS